MKVHLTSCVIIFSVLACLATKQSYADVGLNWCSHRTAQRLDTDINGDGKLDAVCHDRTTGWKWVALHEVGLGLVERWVDTRIAWCSHASAALFVGDVNGDRRGDLVCKDPGRIWIDYGNDDYFQGTDFFVDTNWCTHADATFSIADQDFDGRDDAVCTNADGSVFVDFADESGRFGGTDFFGQCGSRTSSEPFFVVDEPRANTWAQRTGDMQVTAEAIGAEAGTFQTFVGTTGFSNATQMPVLVTARPRVVSGRIRIAGPPFLGYGQTGAALKLVVSDGLNQELCSDEQVLNEQESPGLNVEVPLGQARQLSCIARVSGTYQARVYLRSWASAGGAITSSTDAHVRVESISVRECTLR